ncbi:MAG: hypothetical protein KH074_04235, partial [Faecalibacterium prausnitzii]|nr:hypothetical protein [Faecalibacterium prausnitzii]
MRKTDAFRRAAALMAALSITVSLAAPAFAETYYYIDDGDITITKDENGQTVKQGNKEAENIGADEEIIITTHKEATTTLESDLEGPAAEDTGFGPVVEDNYQPAQPESTEEPEDADQPESTEEPKGADQPESTEEPKAADRQESAEQSEAADQQESADRQAQPQQAAPAAAPAASTPGNGFCKNIITVINNAATALKLTLKDVKIDVSDTGDFATSGKAALSVQGKGNVEIELDGKNELKSGYDRAGLEKNTSEGTLTLKDDNKDGSLKATGGDSGAGIGGGVNGSGENITINGGSVTATGGKWAAGIGGGVGNGKNITINGGTVNATGTDGGAGIGGGDEGSGEDITITGGTVNAAGGDFGAGIGGGLNGVGKNITIAGGRVTVAGGDCGAGIGGGFRGNGENITITGGTVTAAGGNGAGIGGGEEGDGKNITITGGTVTAKGRLGGAGIGGGEQGNGEDITITDGTVNAAGGVSGAGIGGGVNGIGSKVTVSGAAQVTAIAGKPDLSGAGATIGGGGKRTYENGVYTYSDGKEIQADIKGLTTGYIHHIIYNLDDSLKREWWEPERPQPNPEGPNAPAEESNEVDLGTPVLHVETLEGDPLPFDAQQQGSTLRVTSDTLAARLHGTRQALEALREQGVEQIQFVTSFKTTTLSVEDLLAEGGSWFALEHNGLVSRQLSAAQAESL